MYAFDPRLKASRARRLFLWLALCDRTRAINSGGWRCGGVVAAPNDRSDWNDGAPPRRVILKERDRGDSTRRVILRERTRTDARRRAIPSDRTRTDAQRRGNMQPRVILGA